MPKTIKPVNHVNFINLKKASNILWIIGGTFSIIAFALSWYWYGWHLSLILFLAFLGNNLERTKIKEPSSFEMLKRELEKNIKRDK